MAPKVETYDPRVILYRFRQETENEKMELQYSGVQCKVRTLPAIGHLMVLLSSLLLMSNARHNGTECIQEAPEMPSLF